MTYLDNRIERFNRFQQILSNSNRQCGDTFFKLNIGEMTIVPDLYYLGGGQYGTAFDIRHPELSQRNIKVVMKSMDNVQSNLNEIEIGYILSQLTLNRETPHLPLYAKCFSYNGNSNDVNNCLCPINGNCFKVTYVNHGILVNNDQIRGLPNLNPNIQSFINRQDQNNCLLSFSEKLDKDFNQMIIQKISESTSDLHMIKFLFIGLFQSIMGLKAMYDAGYTHSDFHSKNILTKNNMYEESTPYIQYKYNINPYNDETGQNINLGESKITLTHGNILIVLWDFGFATQIPENPQPFPFNNSQEQRQWVLDTFGPLSGNVFNDQGQRYFQKWTTGPLYDITRIITDINNILEHRQAQYPISHQIFNTLKSIFVGRLNKQAEVYGGVNLGTFSAPIFFPHNIDPLVILKHLITEFDASPITSNIVKSIIKFNTEQNIIYIMNEPVPVNSICKIYPNQIYNFYIQSGETEGIPTPFLFGFRSNRKSKRKSNRKSKTKSKRKSNRKSNRKSKRKSNRKSKRKSKRKSNRKSNRKSKRKLNRKSNRKSKRKLNRKSNRKSNRKLF